MPSELWGASGWEEQLYEHLTSHEQRESGLTAEYQEAAARSGSPALQYLVGLIVEDESRHHRILTDLAETVKADVALRSEEPPVPRLDSFGSDVKTVIELTEQLIEREKGDRKDLERLEKEVRNVKDTSLWDLLVKLMVQDTARHIEILEFVRHHAAHLAE